jgi:hypothetical protein
MYYNKYIKYKNKYKYLKYGGRYLLEDRYIYLLSDEKDELIYKT